MVVRQIVVRCTQATSHEVWHQDNLLPKTTKAPMPNCNTIVQSDSLCLVRFLRLHHNHSPGLCLLAGIQTTHILYDVFVVLLWFQEPSVAFLGRLSSAPDISRRGHKWWCANCGIQIATYFYATTVIKSEEPSLVHFIASKDFRIFCSTISLRLQRSTLQVRSWALTKMNARAFFPSSTDEKALKWTCS